MPAMDIPTARAEIVTCVCKTDFPALDDATIEMLVRKSKRQDPNRNPPDSYEPWTAATVYVLGDTVVATERDGGYFTVTVAGTSGATEPTWPTETDGTVVDGTVTWERTGSAPWTPTWNLAYGIAMGWKLKMGKVACAVDISAAGQTIKRSQLLTNLKEVWRMWAMRASTWDQMILNGALRDRRIGVAMTNANDELFIDGQIQWATLDHWGGRGYLGTSPGAQWIDD